VQGVEMMKDYEWIEVPPFCREEFNQCVDLYVKNGWITKGQQNFHVNFLIFIFFLL